ncbi:MAG: DUF4126 domain-containing protein [Candidatus Solibacter sp.]|nr:DUF4126 domain-containing protein [Candidatus Solibacter sp.]
MDAITLLGTALGLGFAAGLRLYATVLALGLALRYELLTLPAALKPLEMLAHPVVIGVAAVMYVAEFISDKIPWFDSAWDAVHTFIRPVGAAALGFAAFSEIDPLMRTVLVLVCGGVALTSHASKAATRVAVNHSPEPFSNWGLSLAGDAAVPAMVWLTMTNPLVVGAVVLVAMVAAVWLIRKTLRLLGEGLSELRRRFA